MTDSNYIRVRGPENQPILIVGDSPSKNANNIKEVLDRNHIIYNSIIIPVKYYTEKYLNENKYRLNEKFNDIDDIFRYVNAIENNDDKNGLDMERDKDKLITLRNEIYDKNNVIKYRIIICLGDFAYFAVRAVLNRYNGHEKHKYGSKNKYSIEDLGKEFYKNSKIDINKDVYILPILHNIVNRIKDVDKLLEFIPAEERNNYISYYCYIGERLGKILIEDINKIEKYKNYLLKIIWFVL